jgi:glutathione synthase/RimK-type ligase-like ATP-grasp enzyme
VRRCEEGPIVALITCRALPEPDADEALYGESLARHGISSRMLAWDDPQADPGDYDACILRSTWNYYRHLDAFLSFVDHAAAVSRLFNPAPVVHWNAHKGYLAELEARGVRVVPTAHVVRGSQAALQKITGARGFRGPVVVKPAVSAGSFRTMRADLDDPASRARAEAHLAELLETGDALVQPYLPEVERSGERAIVCIDGEPTHAVRKCPRFAEDDESVSAAIVVTDAERAFASQVLAAVPVLDGTPLYARVDAIRDDDGELCVMELELIEPSLFFVQAPHALERFAQAVARRL